MGDFICELADTDKRICAITAAMCDGTGLIGFKDKHPDRFFDVGIAEPHALTFAAGLAANGMRPIVAVYSTFLQRGFDNVIHDIALQKLPVIICVDRAGLNSADGATHHGIFDVAFLSEIPDFKIYTPATNRMLEICIKKAIDEGCPCAIRYPNGCESEEVISRFYNGDFEWATARRSFTDSDNVQAVVVTHGRMAEHALLACDKLNSDGITAGVILLERIKPYDKTATAIKELLPDSCKTLVFLEEEIKIGGMGMNLKLKIEEMTFDKQMKTHILAVDESFVTERKTGESIYTSAGIDVAKTVDTIRYDLV